MTTPYVTGTVSVSAGSAIVTGAGTGWQTAGLVAGVFGLDSANGNPIPVLSVDSDTQITLAKPWRGTTASGQAYWITYDTTAGQQTVSNAQRLAEYIARLDKPALAALASLVPAADKLPYFGAGGAAALTDLPAAARALLAGGVLPEGQLPQRLRAAGGPLVSDFDSALSTGFYRAALGANTRPPVDDFYVIQVQRFDNFIRQDAWGTNGVRFFRQGQLGSLPGWTRDGPPERGSNANGEYVRFADGTQICWVTKAFDNGFQNRYWVNWAFPASFSNVETVSLNHNVDINTLVAGGNDVNSATSLWVPSFSDLSTTQALLQLTAGRSILNYQTMKTRAIAVGRWF